MTTTATSPQRLTDARRFAVLGAGGRAGRALIAEGTARGYEVAALVRDQARHADLAGPAVEVIEGDALDADSVATAAAGCDAVVSAVTPFTVPPESFDSFDSGYYEGVTDALLRGAAQAGVERIVVIGLFATLLTHDHRRVLDDPHRFPERLRPFAQAHARGVERLTDTGAHTDWLVLAPPPHLLEGAPRTGHYTLGGNTVSDHDWETPLSYADLAVAVIDQIQNPTHHRTHTAVLGVRAEH